jgi:molybdate transport system regulatory protein
LKYHVCPSLDNPDRLDAALLVEHGLRMIRLTIRIDLSESAAFGPGKARLLELVDQTGSIRQAASAMQMSYRCAWLLLAEIEDMLGESAVITRTGGAGGGGATLTKRGRMMLENYRAIERSAARAASPQLRAIENLVGNRKLERRKALQK